MEWFGNSWEGEEVVFPSRDDQPSTTWKLGAKLAEEKSNILPQRWLTAKSGPSEAWVPFACTQVGASGPEHVVKIYMQIPHGSTMSDKPESRGMQRHEKPSRSARAELEGLQILTQNQCTSAPRLVNYLQREQDDTMWIPGGYILFILMTKCPGKPIENFHKEPLTKRNEIRQAFEDAYKECQRCGVINSDNSQDNLLWDDVAKKCYIVDFKWWTPPSPGTVWSERKLKVWFLHDRKGLV